MCAKNTMPVHQALTKQHLHKRRLQLYSQLIFAFYSGGSFLFQWGRKAAHTSIIHTLNQSYHFCMNQRSVNKPEI